MYFLCIYRSLSKASILRFRVRCYTFKIVNDNAKSLCSKYIKNNALEDPSESYKGLTWSPIYYFPLIGTARLFNRFKLYQSMFTIVALPLSVGFYCYDLANITIVAVMSGSAVFTCFTLYIITSFFKKLIGSIFISGDKKFVKIAHLTFWGNRNDIIVPVDDIIPFTDGNCKVNDAYVKLCRFSCNDVLHLTLRYGKIIDSDTFQNVFGNFEVLGLKKIK